MPPGDATRAQRPDRVPWACAGCPQTVRFSSQQGRWGRSRRRTSRSPRSEVPDPGDDEFVVELTHVSVDPAMRGWMNDMRSYIPPVGIGEVMRAGGIGRVIASRHEASPRVTSSAACSASRSTPSRTARGVDKIVPSDGASLAAHLGVLGMTGMTGVLRAARRRARSARRHSARVGRGRRRRLGRRSARQDQGRPRGRDRGRSREVRDAGRGARLRRRDRLQVRGLPGASSATTRRTASTCSSTTSAARSSTSG